MAPQINAQASALMWKSGVPQPIDEVPVDDNNQMPIDDNAKAPID